MVTTDEIEDLIVKLHNEHKTTREISKAVHKNFSYVGAVLRKRFPEEYSDDNIISKETQALKLFSLKRTPTQVAIELNESTDNVEKYFNNFWRLEGMKSLYRIYLENKKAVPYLVRLYNLFKKKVIPPRMYNQVFDLVEKEIFREDDQASLSDVRVYSAEELERAFTEHDST